MSLRNENKMISRYLIFENAKNVETLFEKTRAEYRIKSTESSPEF